MNFKKFQLSEKIQTLLDSGNSKLLFDCMDVIDNAYVKNQDVFQQQKGSFHIVGFKGTSSIKDLMTDLHYSNTDEFHSGFKDKALSLTDREHLAEQLSSKSNVVLTGHSMGAAVALYEFIKFRTDISLKLTKNIVMLVCFGMPRVGDSGFLQTMLAKAVDAKPTLEPTKALHFIFLKEGNRVDVVSTHPKALNLPQEKLLDFVDYSSLKAVPTYSKHLGIYLHSLESYRESLKHLITQSQ